MLLFLFLSGVPPYLSTDKIESLLQIKRYSYINLYIQCNLTDFVFIVLQPTIIGIAFECYAPLGSPSRMGIVPDEPVVMEDPVINEIAMKYNATPAQV